MSCYKVEFEKKAREDLRRLDFAVSSRIRKFLRRVATQGLPRSTGKPLTGNLAGLWRYRVGDYRLIARIEDERLLIVMVRIEHRSKVYR